MPFRASLLASVSVVAFTNAVTAGPQGGSVVSGVAVISTPAPQALTVTQTSRNAIINWQGFSVGGGESASFLTPAGGATLNRVTGSDPSSIYGTLTSTGRLFLINPNGIVVGPTGVIDTAGLVLSTHSVKDAQFLAGGDMTFSGDSNASVVNHGAIRATGGGDVFLIARHVENTGSISAPGGTVGLAGGTEILIRATDSADGRIAVRKGPGSVKNAGDIAATAAELRAAGGNHYALAVNNTGVVRATGVKTQNGRVFLTASTGNVSSSGKVTARNANGSGGKVKIATAPRPVASATRRAASVQNTVDISGTVDVSADNGAGGSVVIEAEAINIASTARIDASGPAGGGFIAIGGGFQGKDVSILNADHVTVASGAQIVADATDKGDGGKVAIWADGSTTFHGAISARGGAIGGDGGFAEVSGKETITMSGNADMRAPMGSFGTLLIDPGSITIVDGPNSFIDANTFSDAWISSQLGLANVNILTSAANAPGPEDITVKSGVAIVWNSATLLSLRAGNDIIVENNVIISNTQTGNGSTSFVQKDAGGVELLAGNNITIGDPVQGGRIRIGSEFGVTKLVAGDANFNGLPDAPGTGRITISAGALQDSHVQIGHLQPLLRGANTGEDYASPALHAENGTISVLAGGDITLTGGSNIGSFAQIGHGGWTGGDTAEILRSNISVISSGGSVKLDSLGVESGYARIGHGSYFAGNSAGVALGAISGDIHVDALTSVVLNGAPNPSGIVKENGVADVFLARIGHGSHAALDDASYLETLDIAGAIYIGAKAGAALAPATPLALVQLSSAISPGAMDDAREVFSQIGHGTELRVTPVSGNGGTTSLFTGGVRSFLDLNGFATNRPDISVKADEILLNSIIASPLNALPNIERAAIGNGNYVRLEAGAAINESVTDGSVAVAGVNPLVDGLALSQALASDLSLLSAAEVAKLNALAAANTQLVAKATPTATNVQFDVFVSERDLTGDVLVSTSAGTGKGVTLSSLITVADIAVTDNRVLTRIGHGGFVQLTTPNGADGVLPQNVASATPPGQGGLISFVEANVLYSSIRVETNNNDDVTANVSVTAGLAAATTNVLGAAIGSGNEAFLITGAGGAGVGVLDASAIPGAFGGDVYYLRGTVWDGAYTSNAISTGDDGYDTTIDIASQNNIKLATSATAALAEAGENVVLGRIGHGAVISVLTGAGGAGATGSNGGRGGDIRIEQQTPGRDYGINGAADDLAWGLRGQITLQASDLTATPALEITSAATAALAPARSNTISSRVGHGDQILTRTGAGRAGADRSDDTFVTTAHGGRGGHVDVDLSRRLIESRILGLVEGEIKLDASTTNAVAPSTKNLSEAAIGHGDSVQALSGGGGAGGSGLYLGNATTVADSQAAAENFFAFDVFGAQSGSGAARGGNGGDIAIRFGAITERRGPVSGLIHDADANVELTITGANPAKRSLTVNSLIAPGVANGPGDQVTANIGHNTRFIALAGRGGNGGSGRTSLDAGFVDGEALDATTPRPIQNDASGGRGGDVSIIAGAHDSSGAPLFATGAPTNTLVIGRIVILADEQVAVTSTAGPGSDSRAHSGIGHLNDVVALTDFGGAGGSLLGTSGVDITSGANDGVLDSDKAIQVIVNRDGSRGVSLAKNGVADTIQSVAARRTATPANGSTANPSFFDVDGNPEFILDANNNLVVNFGANNALRSAPNNVARFGRIVETYNPGVSNLERVQYVDINNDGRPDVVAAVLSNTSALTLVDADNNNVYDQIAGRVRLQDGNIAPLGLVDYVYATGRTASVAGNRLDWTYSDFSTSNGGRGGDAAIRTGVIRPDLPANPLVTVNAGIANSGAPASDPDFSLVVSSIMLATPVSAGPNNVASARIGVADYLYASSDGTYNAKLAGALHANDSARARGGPGGMNAVNANGGRGGDASVVAGAVTGAIAINPAASQTRGVKVSSFTDDVTSGNRSIAAIGHGGQYFATAANVGGRGESEPVQGSFITESANGGRGGEASTVVGAREGSVNVRAGKAEAGGDFAIVIEAIKGGSAAVADSDDITFSNVGHGGVYVATGGRGGQGEDGQYMANGGAGGAATIDVALTSGAITLDAVTYADKDFGAGVRIEASTSEGGTQKLRAQAGHYGWATATGGAGGSGTVESQITEQFNQQANGGAGGAATIRHAGFAGAVTIDAGAAKSGDNAILIKSSDNTVNSLADNFILATSGHGAFANATGGAGGQSGQRDGIGGLTLAADPAFHEGFDIANLSPSATAPLDTNPIMFGTVRDGGAGGAGAILIGATEGDITLRAHDVDPAGGKDGILITALTGDGANTGSALFGNVAMAGHSHNASATGGAGGSSISSTLAATVTSGDGGSGSVTFAPITGAILVTNIVAGDANATGGALDKNIRIFASDQDATDSANHRATARVGHRTMADAFGGAGGNAALPPPGPMYSATISAQGGFGGAANITSGAVTGDISVIAENSVLVDALNPTVSSPTVVAGIGHHAIANAAAAGAGGFGGVSASFNDAAMLTALRRYVDLGQNYARLSALEKQLVAPVLNYYRIAPVYTGAAGPAAVSLPSGFVARVLAGPAAFIAGSPNAFPLARDNDAIAGAANSVPNVSADESNALIALSMASGHGGDAFVTQGAIAGDITITAVSANTADAARGFQLKTLGVLNAGTQIAHVGHENEVSNTVSGKGQNVRAGTIAEGIGGDGGAIVITQSALSGNLAITAGSTAGATSGDILVSSSGVLTAGWQRSLIGHRQMIGSDDPGFRAQPVARAGDGGGDQDALAQGKLGNGGSVAIRQDSISGALNLAALGTSPGGDSIKVISSANLVTGETLSSIGHAAVVDSVKAGDAIPYTVGPDARASLYGVREGNGGAISIAQSALSGDLTLDASDKLHVESVTALAPGRATTLIGHKQIIADDVYGTRAGTVVAGDGADVLSIEDIDVANGAPGFVNAIHASHVQDADGGNVIISQGLNGGAILLQSRREDVSVLANGNTGETTTYVGHQRFTTALTGEGGVTAGPSGPRSAGEGGAAIIETAALSADISIVAAKAATIKSTSALGSDARVLVGQTSGIDIATGRSGYGVNVYAALDSALAAYLALPAPTGGAGVAGEATARDAARVIHDLENVVAAITIANRYEEHYSPAQQADLAKALADATTALGNARAATLGNVATAVTAAKAALQLANDTVVAGGNPNGIADAADSGWIVYYTPSVVSGDISVRATNVVAVQAEGGDGKTSLVEIGHRHSITNTTGLGAGLTIGNPLDGGVAGDSGSISVSQTTSGNVDLIGGRIVVNPTSGVGAADVHLSHKVDLVNTTGKADIEGLLGRGGAVTSTQTSTGDVLLQGSEYSSSPTGAADGLLMADGGPGASRLRIGVEASAAHLSDSDEMIAALGGADNNRGGLVQAAQVVSSGVRLEGLLTATDLIIRSVGLADKQVRIGALATQTARSGDAVDDGSNVTAEQTVGGDISTRNLEDVVVENNGPGVSTVHIGHTATQIADSGETAGLTSQHGGITTATQSVGGAIGLASTRTFTQQTDGVGSGFNQIGHSGLQIARSADQRTGAAEGDYPIVAGAPTGNFNVVSTQTVRADVSVSSGEILIQSLNGAADGPGAVEGGVRLGNTAHIIVDTHNLGRVQSTQTLGGNIGLTTVAPAAQADALITTAVNGDIRVLTPAKPGTVNVGHESTSAVSHDPAAFQPTGVFVTQQGVVDNINVTALRNVEVRDGEAGVARIGHTIVETSALSTTNAVKTSSLDPSTVTQLVDSDINVTAGNSLAMVTTAGMAQIGHFSPPSNEWQVTDGRVVTPQTISGDVNVYVGLNDVATVVGEAPAVGALGTNNALLDGTAGGEVRIGHKFAPVTGAAANEVQTAAGDIWVEVGAHLHVKTANIGHGPYDFESVAVSKDTAIMGGGTVRNRIAGLTTIGAAQNTPSPQDATVEPNIMLFDGANVNSGYGENGGQLRFFIPSRRNLTITDTAPTQFNDSTSNADAIPPRSDSPDHIEGAVTHENGFLAMSTTALYEDIGAGNFAFYFDDPVSPSYVVNPWDALHRIEGLGGSCIDTQGAGVNAGGLRRARNALAWAYPHGVGGDNVGCNGRAAEPDPRGYSFVPAGSSSRNAPAQRQSNLRPGATQAIAGPASRQDEIVIRMASPAPAIDAPAGSGATRTSSATIPGAVPLRAVRVSGDRILSFASSGTNLVATISPR